MHALAEVPSSPAGADHPPAWRTAEQRQAAARHTYRTARQRGETLTGAELAARYQMSERWGRDRIAEVRADAPNGNDDPEAPPAATPPVPAGNGSRGNSKPPATGRGNGNADTNGNHDDGSPNAAPPSNGNSRRSSDGRRGNDNKMPVADPGKGTGNTGRNGNHDGGDLTTAPRSNSNGPSRPATGDVQNGNPTAATAIGRGNGPTARPASGDEVRDQTNSRPTVLAGVQERSRVDLAIILAVALVAAAASYGHMLKVALIAGEPLLIARAFPITVDGLVLAALRYREPGRHWLKLGIAISVAANVLAQFPDVAANAGPLISAWPPVALYGTHRLLRNHKAQIGRAGARPSTWSRQ